MEKMAKWLSLCVALYCANSAFSAHLDKTYVINLDAPPEERWQQVGRDYPDLPEFTTTIRKALMPETAIPLFNKVVSNLYEYLPEEYVREMQGLADATGGTIEDFVLLNLIYDITVTCTGVIAQDEAGHIWHGRNLDYDFAEQFKKYAIYADFQRNNQTVYRSVASAGIVGTITAMKPHAYTIQINQRDEGTPRIYTALVSLLYENSSPVLFKLRDLMDAADSYADAVEYLSNAVLMAPCYFIIGGAHPGEGAVLTRDRTFTADIWMIDPNNGRWFIAQTNYDHWEPDPPGDNRQTWATKYMNEVGRGNITAESMMAVISAPHVRVPDTVYSTVFSASQPDVFVTNIPEAHLQIDEA